MWFLLSCAVAAPPTMGEKPAMAEVPVAAPGQAVAVFAGGCFWCLESDFDKLAGVVHTTSGYAGGKTENPTYAEVGGHGTGHIEVVHVVFDPGVVTYGKLLDYFWRHVDPTDGGGQFCDRGDQYRTAILPVDAAQQQAAEKSKADLSASGWLTSPIATEILPGQRFWPGEAYHQDYYKTNPARYLPYRKGCGRDARVAEVWKAAPPSK